MELSKLSKTEIQFRINNLQDTKHTLSKTAARHIQQMSPPHLRAAVGLINDMNRLEDKIQELRKFL